MHAARHVNIQHKHRTACLLLPTKEVGEQFWLALLHHDADKDCLTVSRDIMQRRSSPELVRMGRSCAINQVLGTDMKKHFDIVSRFQVRATSILDPHQQLTLFA